MINSDYKVDDNKLI